MNSHAETRPGSKRSPRSKLLAAAAIFTAVAGFSVAPVAASVSPPDTGPTTTEPTALTVPLVRTPTGCDPAKLPYVVFIGTVIDGDYRTRRFRIEQVRAGDPKPFADGDQIDIRYGRDEQYLDVGTTYLVGAGLDESLAVLYSKVTPKVQDFGGDQVVGVSETDVDCDEIEDPARTVYPDGRPIDGQVLSPLGAAWWTVLTAIGLPILLGLGVVFVLALIRNGSRAAVRFVAPHDRPGP